MKLSTMMASALSTEVNCAAMTVTTSDDRSTMMAATATVKQTTLMTTTSTTILSATIASITMAIQTMTNDVALMMGT